MSSAELESKQMPSVPEIITANIIEQLERGVAPWRKPWSTSIPRNLISKKPYRGLNVFLLATQGYGSPFWLTFNQAKTAGAQKRSGLTAAGRKRLSEMKRRWAERRKKTTAKH